MSAFTIIFAAFSVLFVSEGLKLPDYIIPCSRTDPNFNQCALEHGREAIPTIVNGDPKYGVPQLHTILIKEMNTQHSGISLYLNDMTVEGFKDGELQDVKFDFDTFTFSFQLHVPVLMFRGKYEVSGKVVTLPISGKGEANASLGKVTIKYWAFCNLTKKSDGQTYLQPIEFDLVLEPETAIIDFGNLFNGNKILGEAMNNFLTKNFKLLTESVGRPVFRALGSNVHQILTGLAERVPYDELFTKDN